MKQANYKKKRMTMDDDDPTLPPLPPPWNSNVQIAPLMHGTLAVFEPEGAMDWLQTRRKWGPRKRKQALDDCGFKIIHGYMELAMKMNIGDCKSRFDGADGMEPVIKKQRVFEQVRC
jgi:hypothetical protein